MRRAKAQTVVLELLTKRRRTRQDSGKLISRHCRITAKRKGSLKNSTKKEEINQEIGSQKQKY